MTPTIVNAIVNSNPPKKNKAIFLIDSEILRFI
jgi:hypothetical protein